MLIGTHYDVLYMHTFNTVYISFNATLVSFLIMLSF